jgi:hypothetical protein
MIAAIVLAVCVVRPSGSLYDATDGRTSDSQNAGRRPMSAEGDCAFNSPLITISWRTPVQASALWLSTRAQDSASVTVTPSQPHSSEHSTLRARYRRGPPGPGSIVTAWSSGGRPMARARRPSRSRATSPAGERHLRLVAKRCSDQ